MGHTSLQGCRVLLVEDDFLIADDFARRLEAVGAEVIGPAATLPAALALYESSERLDVIILDINLRGTNVFPLAEQLLADGVPFLFCTGYGDEPIRNGLAGVPRFEKPISHHGFTAMIELIRQMQLRSGQAFSHTPASAPHLPM